jgi:hypothetical protein
MKKFFVQITSLLQAIGTARAATILTRMGRWRDAQSLMSK